ncbi:F-box/kelch-repeat protein [Platanthera guangdongensis]|uniref:F-box/kelch-repeat protein n=1 Tax=Platanthera guangdongensis TaxID=2320717 RepID=A0ABR2LID1_9ASPA
MRRRPTLRQAEEIRVDVEASNIDAGGGDLALLRVEEIRVALLPGLPDDVALDCIARIPHRFHPGLRQICRRWRDLVAAPSFRCHRQRINKAEDLIFLVQALGGGAAESTAGDAKDSGKTTAAPDLCPPIYAISICSVADGSWHRLASPEPVPMFAQVFVMGAAGEEGSVGGRGYRGWILDIEGGKWRRAVTPAMFAGFPYSAATVRL